MSDLLNCPFCGGKAELDTQQHYTYMKHGQPRTGTRVVIYCLECSADMGICHEDDECADSEGVTTLWNARAEQALALSEIRIAELKDDYIGMCAVVREKEQALALMTDERNALMPQPCCQEFDTCERRCIPLVHHLRKALALRGEPVADEKIRQIAERCFYDVRVNGVDDAKGRIEDAILAGIALVPAVSGERVREACAMCEGRGDVATVEYVEHHAYPSGQRCPECSGSGFKERRALPLAAQPEGKKK